MDGKNVMDITYKKIIFAALIFGVAFHAGDDILYQYKVLGNSSQQFNKYVFSGHWHLDRVERMQFINDVTSPGVVHHGVLYMPVAKRLRTYQIQEMVSKLLDKD